MKKQKFTYEAVVKDIHDGDTITVEFDLGFNTKFTEKIRFYGINAPELRMRNEKNKLVENPKGTQTLEEVKKFLKVGDTIVVETIKDKKEKFGRYLGNVYVTRGEEQIKLNDYLLENGFAEKLTY